MREVAVRGLKMWGVGIFGCGLLNGAASVADQRDRGQQMTMKAFMQGYQFGCIKAAIIPPVVVANAIFKAIEKASGRDR